MRIRTTSLRSGPVVVGVDGSERSVEALALADLLGPALRRPVVIAYVHPYGKLSSLFSENEYERLVREVAESTFDQIREHLPSVPERRLQLVSEESPAAGLHALAEREASGADRDRLVAPLEHRPHPRRRYRRAVAVPGPRRPWRSLLPATPPPGAACRRWGVGSTARRKRSGRSRGRPRSRAQHRLGFRDSERLRKPTLPTSLAVGGGLAIGSITDVLRRERQEELAEAVAALDPDTDADAELMEGDARELLARKSGELDLLVVGSREYGPLRAVLLGSVSSATHAFDAVPRAATGDARD